MTARHRTPHRRRLTLITGRATPHAQGDWSQYVPVVALPATCALIGASVLAFIYGLAAHSRWHFLALGLVALAVVIWPFVRIPSLREVVSVWGIVVLNVAAGITARSVFIATGTPDEETIQRLFLLGHTTDYFVWPSVLLVVGLLITTIAYFFVTPRRRHLRLPDWLRRYQADERRVYIVAFALIGLGVLAAALFAAQTGGLDLTRPSAKRAVAPGLQIDESYRGLGYLRSMADLVGIGFLVVLAYFTTTRKSLRGREVLTLLGMFLSASLIPIYASSRSGLLWPILLALAILFYSGYRLRLRHLAVAALVALAVMHYLGELRELRDESLTTADISYAPDVGEWATNALLGRHSLEVAKMGHVVNNVPHVLDQKYGSTVWVWGVAWIPRGLWPEKPPIHVGPELGRLYGMRGGGGVPPGFYAEAFWNFGVTGVLLGSALLGAGLRWLHNLTQPHSSRDMVLISLYSIGLLRLAGGVVGTGIGFGIFTAAMNVAMAVLVLWFIRSPVHTRRYLWRA